MIHIKNITHANQHPQLEKFQYILVCAFERVPHDIYHDIFIGLGTLCSMKALCAFPIGGSKIAIEHCFL